MEILDPVHVFSWSAYNVGVGAALLAAVAGSHLSVRSFLQFRPVGVAGAALAFAGLVATAAEIGVPASGNAETIQR